jgi:hypothetical protein
LNARDPLPPRRHAETFEFIHEGHRYQVTLGFYMEADGVTPGRLGEIFMNAGKIGTALDIAVRDTAIAVSIALQHGADPEALRRAFLRDGAGRAEGVFGKLFDLMARAD